MMPSDWSPKPNRKKLGWILATSLVVVGLVVGLVSGFWLSQTHPNALKNALSAAAKGRKELAKVFTLPGHVVPALQKAKDGGALANDRQIQISVAVPMTNQAGLRAQIAALYDPAAPNFHQFLSPSDFAVGGQYGPSVDAVRSVRDYLTANGLTVSDTSPNNQFIDASGSASAIESAFHIQLHEYTVKAPDGTEQTYYAPTSDPSVATNLAPFIQNISGLSNYSVYHSDTRLAPNATAGYTPADLQKAYGADQLLGQGLDGTGQSIAFLELSDYNPSDISTYQQKYGVTGGTAQKITVDGGASDNKGATEVELDMEVAFAMAPKITEYVYEGPNSGQGLNDIYSQIVQDDKAKIVSISWGLCEQALGSAELQTLDQIFQQGAAEGIAFFAAAGDAGAYDCGDSSLNVDSPADDPFVTGVGGTSLTLNGDGSYGGESAWSCTDPQCTDRGPNGAGGGGGVSQQFALPSFQQGLTPVGVNSANGRFVPDVSADADPQTGYAVYCTVSAGGCDSAKPDIVVGGTSAAAPLWAAGMALVSEGLAQQGKGAVGNANVSIYATDRANSAAFHDVQSGDNLYYRAGAGYDLATGIGSANFAALLQSLTPGSSGTGTGGTGGTGGTTATPGPQPGGTQELLANNGFENGQNPWGQSSAGNYQLIDTQNPLDGSYSADLCGYDNCDDAIYQAFQTPQQFTNATLSYQWMMITQESGGCNDTFTVAIYSTIDNGDGTLSLGNQIAQAQAACASDANGHYAKFGVDLTGQLQGQAGKTLAIVFHTTSDGQNPTRVFVDDVSLSVG